MAADRTGGGLVFLAVVFVVEAPGNHTERRKRPFLARGRRERCGPARPFLGVLDAAREAGNRIQRGYLLCRHAARQKGGVPPWGRGFVSFTACIVQISRRNAVINRIRNEKEYVP